MITKIQQKGPGLTFGKSIDVFIKDNEEMTKKLDAGVEKIIDDTAAKLAETASRLTPVDTGKAKRSWATSEKVSTTNKGRKKRVHVFNTARASKDNKSGHYYIRHVNDGTITISPRLFFEKAIAMCVKYQEQRMNSLIKKLNK